MYETYDSPPEGQVEKADDERFFINVSDRNTKTWTLEGTRSDVSVIMLNIEKGWPVRGKRGDTEYFFEGGYIKYCKVQPFKPAYARPRDFG